MKLSIVLGTYNRLTQLKRCLLSIYDFCEDYEVIVVDGGSTDGTLDFLETNKLSGEGRRIWSLRQGKLLGACKAFNAGFAVARGEYVFNFNDDAWLVDKCLEAACTIMDKKSQVGQVAIPFGRGAMRSVRLDYTMPLADRRWLYGNFAVTRRALGDRLGWWGTDYYTYGGDAEISMKIWNAGYEVHPLHGYRVRHEETRDELRRPNTDSPLFYAKWRQWKGPGDNASRFAVE